LSRRHSLRPRVHRASRPGLRFSGGLMASSVIDRDMGYSRLMRLVRLPQPHVAVGIQGEDATKTIKDENGEILQVVLAGVHEFGREDGSIPERSYIRATVDANRSRYRQLQKRLIGLVVEGKLTP